MEGVAGVGKDPAPALKVKGILHLAEVVTECNGSRKATFFIN